MKITAKLLFVSGICFMHVVAHEQFLDTSIFDTDTDATFQVLSTDMYIILRKSYLDCKLL